jgi:hypothetical protein
MGEALAATPAPLAGQILGHVRSSSGVAQMGATVLLYNRYDQLVRQALTTEQGRFAFDALAPDLYSLRVTLASFMPALRRNIAVAAGSENVLQINLASVLSTVELVSSGASRGTLMSDDWKWVLRSSSAVVVSSQNANREWVYSQQQTVSAEGYSGQAFNPHFPHTTSGGGTTKNCTDCHLSKDNDNNAIMTQLLGFGNGSVNFFGRYAYVGAGRGGAAHPEGRHVSDQRYDAIFLSNLAAGDLGRDLMKLVESAVRDFGVGLVCIGGDQSYAAGGYRLVDRRARARGSTRHGDTSFRIEIEWPKQPVKSQLLEIVLRDLNKLGLYLHLLRPGNIGLFHNRIDELQVVGRVSNNETTGLRKKIGAGTWDRE